jgi:hypothetical protein
VTFNPETSIWHYCDLAKYVGLLSRGLFFALPGALRRADPWEGSWGELDFVESLDATVHASPDGVAKWRAALQFRHEQQEAFGVSCWHESSTESAALWQLYAPLGLGVAVKSSPAKVLAALGARPVEAKRIDYKGHNKRKLGDNPLVLLSTKRPEFQHEQEIRFFATLTSDERTVLTSFYAQIENHGTVRHIRPGNKGPLITNVRGFSVSDATCLDRCAPAGVHLPTNVRSLVDRVYLAPACAYSLRRAVIDVTERFGLDRKVIAEADFDLAPFDRVEFE